MNKEQIALLRGMNLDELAKAVKEIHGLSGTEHLNELWQDLHGIPKAGEEVVSGPAMISSGSGAEKAVKEYTNPAPQVGVTKEYTEFATVLADFHENFGSTAKSIVESMKSFTDALASSTAKIVTAKAEGKDAKSESALSKAWNDLAELETAIAKADIEGEEKDIEGLDTAKDAVEEAEEHLDEVKDHEVEELAGMKSINQAYLSMQRGWNALSKATALARFGLTGEGNQKDEAVPDHAREKVNETVEGMDGATGVVEAKSRFRAVRKAHEDGMEKKDPESKAMYCAKVEDPAEHEKLASAMSHFHHAVTGRTHPADEAAHKAVRDALHKYSDRMTPEHKAEVEHHGNLVREHAKEHGEEHKADGVSAASGMEKSNAELKAEMAALKAEFSSATRTPAVVPVILKSGAGAASTIDKMNDAVISAMNSGELSSGNAMITQRIIGHLQQAANGHLPENLVKAEIASADPQVRSFLDSFSVAN